VIQLQSIYRHKHTRDYVLTERIVDGFVWFRTLTRDLNCHGGFCLEQHHAQLRFPTKRFEKDWEYLKYYG
jgi:hypothetical protein